MALADLKTLMNASAQNMSQFKGLSAAYGILLGGTPSIDGYTALINANNASNFGAGPTGPTFNDENIYINTINALYQGNATAKANFDAIVSGAATIQDALTAVYNYVIPASARTQAGLDYFKSQASFYAGRAAELGVAGTNGTALVAFASLTKIAVDNDIGGLGDTINDLRAAVDADSAVIPQGGTVFTPLETADGTSFDADDVTPGSSGSLVLTTDADTLSGNAFDAPLRNLSGQANVESLNSTDKLTGTGTNATLTAVLNSGTPVSPTLNGVETIKVTSLTAVGGNTLNLVNATGEKTLINDGSTAGLTFRNVDLTKDTKIVATQTGGNFTQVSFKDLSATDNAVAVEINNSTGNVFLVPETAGVIETVNVTLNGDSTFNSGFVIGLGGAITAATTLNVSGGASINNITNGVGALAVGTFDASKATGNIISQFSGGAQSVKTGSGADQVIFTAAGTSKVALGAGNDFVDFRGFLTTADEVDGGDGRDVIQVSAGLGASKLNTTGIEILRISDGASPVTAVATSTYDVNHLGSIDTVQVRNTGGSTITLTNIDTGNKIQLQGQAGQNAASTDVGTIVVNVENSAVPNTDSLDIGIGRVASSATATDGTGALTATALTVANVETLNFLSTGTNSANTITTLTANAVQTINITGDDALNFGGPVGGTTVNVINASSFTGNLTLVSGAGDGVAAAGSTVTGVAITGGSGNDFLTGGANVDLILGGAGNDTLRGGGALDTFTGGDGSDGFVLDTITGADRITVTDFTAGSDRLVIDETSIGLDGKGAGSAVAAAGGATAIAPATLAASTNANYQALTAGTAIAAGTAIVELEGALTDGTAAGLVTALGTTATDAGLAAGDQMLFINYLAGNVAQVWAFVYANANVDAAELTLVATLQGVAPNAIGPTDIALF